MVTKIKIFKIIIPSKFIQYFLIWILFVNCYKICGDFYSFAFPYYIDIKFVGNGTHFVMKIKNNQIHDMVLIRGLAYDSSKLQKVN
jgi:hypothetical protein